jgi:hypothetical protein
VPAAVAEQQGRAALRVARSAGLAYAAAQRTDELVGVKVGERSQPGGGVAEDAGGDTAEAEDDGGTEDGFPDDAAQHLDAVGRHGLDQNGVEPVGEPPGRRLVRAAHRGSP